MTFETDLFNVLKGVNSEVYPDIAPQTASKPYIVWQGIGGKSMRYVDGAASDKRNTLMQIAVWSTTRAQSLALIRSVEDALCSSALFVCAPETEPLSTIDFETNLFGSIQRFSIFSSR